jgi:flagellar basal body P-ring formation protein FlgA
MIRLRIQTIAAILGLLSALAGPLAAGAAAQTALPALRASVTVTDDVVRIGDLVENAGVVADVPVFRSPDLGTVGTVPTERIVEAIRPHQLIDIDTRGLTEVVVARPGRTITSQEIATRIAQVLAGQNGLGEAQNITVYFDREVRPLQVEANAAGALRMTGLSYDPRSARFDVTFDLPSSALLRRQPARFSGTAIETIPAVAVDRTVEHGEVLKESDLTILRRPKTEGGAIASIADVVGLAARHQLRSGQPLHAADLMKPEVVQRNDTVTLVYQVPGITLTLRGQAQEAGALGDSISVLNAESKRVVQAVVTGPGQVAVNAVATRVVDNTPARQVVSEAPEQSQ